MLLKRRQLKKENKTMIQHFGHVYLLSELPQKKVQEIDWLLWQILWSARDFQGIPNLRGQPLGCCPRSWPWLEGQVNGTLWWPGPVKESPSSMWYRTRGGNRLVLPLFQDSPYRKVVIVMVAMVTLMDICFNSVHLRRVLMTYFWGRCPWPVDHKVRFQIGSVTFQIEQILRPPFGRGV